MNNYRAKGCISLSVFQGKHAFPLFIAVLIGLGQLACRKNSEGEDKSDLKGYISEGSDYLWPNATASVCWEKNISQEKWNQFAPTREKMATYVTSQMARAGFTLNGWQPCEPNSRGIRIAQKQSGVDKETDLVRAFGRRIDGLHEGVLLSMNHSDTWAQTTALHELGHAIGLRHEGSRRDSTCAQDLAFGQGEEQTGAYPQGNYDRDSIMNYCKESFKEGLGFVVPLSSGDIATIKALYSGKPTFPREESCRKDGNSWVANLQDSCCRLAPGKTTQPNAQYPICPLNSPQPMPAVAPGPQPQPPQETYSTGRLSARSVLKTLIKLPFGDNTGLTLICDQGEYFKISEFKRGVNPQEIVFGLQQAAGLGRDSFRCTHLDSYQLDSYDAKKANPNNKMGRLTFPNPVEIKVGQESGTADYTNIQWQIFDNPQKSPTINPNPIQSSAYSATKLASVVLEKFPPKTQIDSPYLVCGSEKIAGQALVAGSESGAKLITFTVPENATCNGLEVKVGLPIGGTNDFQVQFLAIKFDKNIDIKSQKSQFSVSVPAPSCLSKPENKPTQPPVSTSANCDMSKAAENNGWGYDHAAKTPCKGPSPGPAPTPSPSTGSSQQANASHGQTSPNCDMSKAAENNGWGYDHAAKTSCKGPSPGPAPTPSPSTGSSQQANTPNGQTNSQCDMSKAAENNGWGYNHTKKESCK